MENRILSIGIITYPDCMASAVFGLMELFDLANDGCRQNGIRNTFETHRLAVDALDASHHPAAVQVVIVPPSIVGDYCYHPDASLIDWLRNYHSQGGTLCSVCAGAFILAETGLLHHRPATTNWVLADDLSSRYPAVDVDTNKILINDGDIITAGGLMSWVDLGLELVAQHAGAGVMRQVGKIMVVDTGQREQRYYQSFSPKLDHGDHEILKAQHHVHYPKPITVSSLAETCALGERTFLRRFSKATGIKPVQYLQRVRIQKACDLLETTNLTVDIIAHQVGYEDPSAFRKTFRKIMGLTPREFKRRFAEARS